VLPAAPPAWLSSTVIRSDAVRHAARPEPPGFAGGGDAGAGDAGGGETAGADEAGAGALDGEAAGGWVPALDSPALGVGVGVGVAEPHAATSDVAINAPASHATGRMWVREDLDMACSFRTPVKLTATVFDGGTKVRIRELPSHGVLAMN
jgi:hypothetical protein